MLKNYFTQNLDLKYKSHELLEVIDEKCRVLAICPRPQVQCQKLDHKNVFVLVYDRFKSLYIQQRSFKQKLYPGYWDVSAAGHVRAGESKEESALRELEEELGIIGAKLNLINEIKASPATDNAFISIFTCKLNKQFPRPNPNELEQGIFMEKHELDYFINNYFEHISPALLHLWRIGALFKL